MPKSLIKTKKDEKLWSAAKRAAKHADAKKPYAFATWWFKKHHEKGKGGPEPATKDE